MHSKELIGRMVISRAGKDINDVYIIVNMDRDIMYLANGDNKTFEFPKKKKLKHMILTNTLDEGLKGDILKKDKNINLKIKRFLKLNA